MIKKIRDLIFYYDTFKDEIVLTKDRYAAPERYFIVYGGTEGVYKDTFVKDDNGLDYAYTSFERWKMEVYSFLKKYHFEDSVLYVRKYPMKKFIELLKDYGFKVINDEEIEVEE